MLALFVSAPVFIHSRPRAGSLGNQAVLTLSMSLLGDNSYVLPFVAHGALPTRLTLASAVGLAVIGNKYPRMRASFALLAIQPFAAQFALGRGNVLIMLAIDTRIRLQIKTSLDFVSGMGLRIYSLPLSPSFAAEFASILRVALCFAGRSFAFNNIGLVMRGVLRNCFLGARLHSKALGALLDSAASLFTGGILYDNFNIVVLALRLISGRSAFRQTGNHDRDQQSRDHKYAKKFLHV